MVILFFFFFNDTATTEIYTLSLHDALPIWAIIFSSRPTTTSSNFSRSSIFSCSSEVRGGRGPGEVRSEEHTSELQSRSDLVCRLLLEKKKTNKSKLIR